ncbi:unnamed protein product [Bemisia tabaci]|uniref:Beta-galactosidase n=1 Tax=Bemisia tabaci TaxID=7038 RepID=A0A9P0AD28_BEMTA|nr:unnamed protein product [Bemisia tabaci]
MHLAFTRRYLTVFCVFAGAYLCIFSLLPAGKHDHQFEWNFEGINRTFVVDYEANEFRKDGEIFRYVAGEMHYFRVPRTAWRDRMRKLRAAGFNALSTYVHWYAHEPFPGVYDFSGQNDLLHYIQLAGEEGLYVLFRPGPYICAEVDFGGFPPWLLKIDPNMNLRSNDPVYKEYVARWYAKLMPMIQNKLYGNGGPIIMVQVENEFGSYPCDRKYMFWLKELTEKYVQGAALLYTTDGAGGNFFKCGPVPGVFATVDFGNSRDVEQQCKWMKDFNKGGPCVNSEYYAGWLTHWAGPYETAETPKVVNTLADMLSHGYSVSIYMIHGGTNFGFTNGANYRDVSLQNLNGQFQPDPTSYDYNAPITEAGDLTGKYFAIRQVLKQFANEYKLSFINMPLQNSPKGNYGSLKLDPLMSIFDADRPSHTGCISSKQPLTFEEVEIFYGHALYRTKLPAGLRGAYNLSVTEIRDHAFVYLDQGSGPELKGLLSRLNETFSLDLKIDGVTNGGEVLSLFVENLGHINYGARIVGDVKGIIGSVKLNETTLSNWEMCNYTLSNIQEIQKASEKNGGNFRFSSPTFFTKKFRMEARAEQRDTFVDFSGWGKGVIFINGFNLGRYWPVVGPQQTLYLPGTLLKPYPEVNQVTLFEMYRAPANLTISFVDYHSLNDLRLDLSQEKY